MLPAMRLALLMLLAGLPVGLACGEIKVSRPMKYSDMCDASAAVAINERLFVVACDEDNILRIYRNDAPGPPVQKFDLSRFLQLHTKHPETDLEGAARLGDRVFWISSHGRNIIGKERVNRHCFFATDLKVSNRGVDSDRGVAIVPVGRPY